MSDPDNSSSDSDSELKKKSNIRESKPKRKPCFAYLKGNCKKGKDCPFKHIKLCPGCPDKSKCKLFHDPNVSFSSNVQTTMNSHTEKILVEKETRFDVIISIDTSGSMNAGGLDAAKKALRNFHSFLHHDDGISLTSFANEIKELSTLSNKSEQLDFPETIDKLTAGGNTKPYDAIVHGINQAKASFEWNMKKKNRYPSTYVVREPCLVILTDGADNGSTTTLDDVIAIIKDISMPNFRIYIIAVENAIDIEATNILKKENRVEVINAVDQTKIVSAFEDVRKRITLVKSSKTSTTTTTTTTVTNTSTTATTGNTMPPSMNMKMKDSTRRRSRSRSQIRRSPKMDKNDQDPTTLTPAVSALSFVKRYKFVK